MKAPVKREMQIITSSFGERTLNGKKQFHRGVDLRSVFLESGSLQPVVLTEKSILLRHGTDQGNNDFAVFKPLISDYDELKYIHVSFDADIMQDGVTLEEDTIIGFTQIKGQSPAHHLHFETWKKINGVMQAIDPVLYFKKYNIEYRYKGEI